jgi:hypothetical protein
MSMSIHQQVAGEGQGPPGQRVPPGRLELLEATEPQEPQEQGRQGPRALPGQMVLRAPPEQATPERLARQVLRGQEELRVPPEPRAQERRAPRAIPGTQELLAPLGLPGYPGQTAPMVPMELRARRAVLVLPAIQGQRGTWELQVLPAPESREPRESQVLLVQMEIREILGQRVRSVRREPQGLRVPPAREVAIRGLPGPRVPLERRAPRERALPERRVSRAHPGQMARTGQRVRKERLE